MSVGTKLKDLRIKTGESLQQVADAVGVSKAHIWELETNKSTNPGLELLKRLADHFKVTVAFLANDMETSEDAAPLQFFREFNDKLTEKDWQALRNMAAHLKNKTGDES